MSIGEMPDMNAEHDRIDKIVARIKLDPETAQRLNRELDAWSNKHQVGDSHVLAGIARRMLWQGKTLKEAVEEMYQQMVRERRHAYGDDLYEQMEAEGKFEPWQRWRKADTTLWKREWPEVDLYRVGRDSFNIRSIRNRRFVYNDTSGEVVFGSNNISSSSHSEEWFHSGATGKINDCTRGWIGFSGNYKNGIIHFAPPESYSSGYDTIQMFLLHGATDKTFVRGFAGLPEVTIAEALSGKLKPVL